MLSAGLWVGSGDDAAQSEGGRVMNLQQEQGPGLNNLRQYGAPMRPGTNTCVPRHCWTVLTILPTLCEQERERGKGGEEGNSRTLRTSFQIHILIHRLDVLRIRTRGDKIYNSPELRRLVRSGRGRGAF